MNSAQPGSARRVSTRPPKPGTAAHFRNEASNCRRLAAGLTDPDAVKLLTRLADENDAKAAEQDEPAEVEAADEEAAAET